MHTHKALDHTKAYKTQQNQRSSRGSATCRNEERKSNRDLDLKVEAGGRTSTPTHTINSRIFSLLIKWVLINTFFMCAYTHHMALPPQLAHTKHPLSPPTQYFTPYPLSGRPSPRTSARSPLIYHSLLYPKAIPPLPHTHQIPRSQYFHA